MDSTKQEQSPRSGQQWTEEGSLAMEQNERCMETDDKLSTADALRILNECEKGLHKERITTINPFRPRGGQLFIIDWPELPDKRDSRSDGYRWQNMGLKKYPKRTPTVLKSIFKVKTKTGYSETFQRHTFEKINDSRYCILHYLGDETVYEDLVHGNTKSVVEYTPLKFKKLPYKTQTETIPSEMFEDTLNRCLNCHKRFKEDDSTETTYGRRKISMSRKIQDRVKTTKKNVSVLEALEEVMPERMATITSHMLHSCNYFICVRCMTTLRGAYNCKIDAREALIKLHDRAEDGTESSAAEAMRGASKESFFCWFCKNVCLQTNQRHSKVTLATQLIEGLSIADAVEAILPELLPQQSRPKTFMCRNCFLLLKKTSQRQHRSEEMTKEFIARIHRKSLMRQFLRESGNDIISDEDSSASDSSEDCNDEEDELLVEEHQTEGQSKIEMVEVPQDVVYAVTSKINEEQLDSCSEVPDKMVARTSSRTKRKDHPETTSDSNLAEEINENESLAGLENSIKEKEQHSTLDEVSKNLVGEEDAFIQKVTFLLKQKSYLKAVRMMTQFGFFREKLVAAVVQHITSEIQMFDLDSSPWSLTFTSADSLTPESMKTLVTNIKTNLPTLTAILAGCLVHTGDRTDISRSSNTIQRLLGVISTVLMEQKMSCNLIHIINSVLMAKSGCTEELFSRFNSMSYCLSYTETCNILERHGLNVEKSGETEGPQLNTGSGSRKRSKPSSSTKQQGKRAKLKEKEDEDDDQVDVSSLLQSCLVHQEEEERDDQRQTPTVQLSLHPGSLSSLEKGVQGDVKWELCYNDDVSGIAEIVRLLFEESGAKYVAHHDAQKPQTKPGGKNITSFSLPIIKKGSFQLGETPVICQYLGEEFKLYPDRPQDRAHAQQVSQVCIDFIKEVWALMLGQGDTEELSALVSPDKSQLEVQTFVKKRVPHYLKYLEKIVNVNSNGRGYLFGKRASYADFALLQVLRVTENQFPGTWTAMKYVPGLKAFKIHMAARPRISDYLKSKRCRAMF